MSLPRRLAVVGAGFMGGGIAAELALRLPELESVRIWDTAAGAAERAVQRAAQVAATLVGAGVLRAEDAPARLARLRAAGDLAAAVDGAGYIAEAVPEDLPVKQETFRRLDACAAADAILASNTSGLNPSDLAAGLTHPERVVVAHYFGPAYLIPLVEVVPHPGTDRRTVETTLDLLRAAGKRPVELGRYVPGFVANRLQQALFREALHLVQTGVATPSTIDEVVRYAFAPRLAALGPMTVADFAGLDVYAALARTVWPDLSAEPAQDALPPLLAEHAGAGTLGTKTGSGFYSWPADRLAGATARRDAALSQVLRQAAGGE